MSENGIVHVTQIDIHEGKPSLDTVQFLLTDTNAWLAHINLDDQMHALVYPAHALKKSTLLRGVNLSIIFFADPSKYEAAFSQALEQMFGEKQEISNTYTLDLTAPVGKPSYYKGDKPFTREEERMAFLATNSSMAQAVELDISTVYQLILSQMP